MYTASQFSPEKKLKVIKSYLEKSSSLRKHAHSLGISYMTLWRWVKKYRQKGKEALRKSHKKSGKRFSKNLEKKIMMVKEQNPSVTISGACKLLKRTGITVSAKGVWGVWHRYGLLKKNNHDPLDPFGDSTPESLEGLRKVKSLLSEGNLKAAAVVLNDLPSMPKDEILRQIPEEFLSPRRRLERFYLESDKTSPHEAVTKARRIGSMLKKRGYLYSSIFANLLELYDLHNMGKPQETLRVLKTLDSKLDKTRNRSWLILYYALMAMAFSERRKLNRALEFTKKCRRLIGVSSYPWHWMVLGSLHTHIGNYVKALHSYKMGLEMTRGQELFPYFATSLVLHGYCMTGDYINAKKLLDEVSVLDISNIASEYYLGRAYIAFSQGDLKGASQFFLEVLKMSSKHNLSNHLRASASGLAFVAAARNKKSQARTYLKRCIPLLKKHGSTTELYMLKLYLTLLEGRKISKIRKRARDDLFYLLYRAKKSLKVNHYRKAFNHAEKHGHLGLFERVVVFAPEPVLHMIEQGKDPGLSKAIMQFPLFNHKKAVCHIKFLGELVVSKNGHRLNLKLAPKERAFLIHLALKAGQPGKFILLKEIYHNFWPGSQCNKMDLLSHMLSRIRRAIKIWRYFLCVTSSHGQPRLINRGVYFTTDYEKVEASLIHAKALEKADDRRFALQNYMHALKMFRGAPFEKMYDNWSENMRWFVLNQLTIAAVNFIRIYTDNKNSYQLRVGTEIKKVVEKISEIIPHSEEIKHFLENHR